MGRDIGRRLQKGDPSQSADGESFATLLEGLQSNPPSSDAPTAAGMGIRDYWKRPVTAALASVREPSTPSNGSPAVHAVRREDPGESTSPAPGEQIDTPAEAPPPTETRQTPSRGLSADASIAETIRAAAAKYDLPATLIRSVIRAESNFQPDAVSPAGARGLMQLMPATAAELGVADAFDIEQNIDGGTRYLRQMLDMFDGNVKQALAAYNAGPGTVMRYNGNVPYRETRNYVSKVLAFTKQYAV
jgi:hypothetical protein